MSQGPRPLYDGGMYHIIARGNNRLAIFSLEGAHEFFLSRCLKQAKEKFPGWKLFHWCAMSNHLHFLTQMLKGAVMPKLMQFVLLKFSLWYKRQTNYVGHVWQRPYKSLPIEDERYFLECGRYIELNPVRARIVSDPKAYPWSSYGYYAFGKKDPVIDADPYYASLGKDPLTRQRNYRELVKIERPYDKLLDNALFEKRARKGGALKGWESVREM